MHVKQIEAFLAVAQERSFTKASARLFLSQPSISKTIRSLESELGFRLFVRSAKQIELTPEGLILFHRWKQVPRIVDEAVEAARHLSSGQKDRIAIGLMKDREVSGLLEHVYRQWRSESVRYDLSFEVDDYPALRRGLRTGRFDAILLPDVEVRPSDGFESSVITRQTIIIALSRNLKIAQQAEIPLQDLGREPFLLLADGEDLSESAALMKEMLESIGILSPRFTCMDSMDSLMLNVELGSGIALLGMHSYLENHPTIRFIEVRDSRIDIVVAWLADNRKAGLQDFLHRLRQQAPIR